LENQNLENWEKRNDELLKKMDEWRDSYTCSNNCSEWQKWKFCKHLVKARVKKFGIDIRKMMEGLVQINSKVIVFEQSQH